MERKENCEYCGKEKRYAETCGCDLSTKAQEEGLKNLDPYTLQSTITQQEKRITTQKELIRKESQINTELEMELKEKETEIQRLRDIERIYIYYREGQLKEHFFMKELELLLSPPKTEDTKELIFDSTPIESIYPKQDTEQNTEWECEQCGDKQKEQPRNCFNCGRATRAE